MSRLQAQSMFVLIALFYLCALIFLSYHFSAKPDGETEKQLLQLQEQLRKLREIRGEAETRFNRELLRVSGTKKPDNSIDINTFAAEEAARELILRRSQKAKDAQSREESQPMKTGDTGLIEINHDIDATTYLKTEHHERLNLQNYSSTLDLSKSKIVTYLKSHAGFPIVLLCYNRAEELDRTIKSLLMVRGVEKSSILAVQDGGLMSVTRILEKHGIDFLQRPGEIIQPPKNPKLKIEPGDKIARHYGYALRKAFDHFHDSPGLIIVEDDFLFSPDFMEFFVHVAPAIELDNTLWIASAWNDNGFAGVVRDPSAIRRTDHFPGLGWLLIRDIWNEIKDHWPKKHWDWFMRNPKTSKGRDCVFPEVPRDYHTGAKGTYMDMKTHNKYFAGIAYNKDTNFHWDSRAAQSAILPNYENRVTNLIKKGYHVSHGKQLIEMTNTAQTYILWYDANPHPKKEKEVIPLMGEFRLWHQLLRGAWQGVHEFWYNEKRIIMINVFDPTKQPKIAAKAKSIWFFGYPSQTRWIKLKPAGTRVFDPRILFREIRAAKGKILMETSTYKVAYATDEEVGKSCDEVCSEVDLACNAFHLVVLNTCDQLQNAFDCKACKNSYGVDQPSFIVSTGECMVNSKNNYFSCDGKYADSRRLCACVTHAQVPA